jgi:ABC-type transport system involved in cytochrome bd biosynthesis fused ATPase/permease subunit
LDYEIVDKGRNISSGEKRKLELSRALLSDASCFVFDEVVSTLDIETAYEIEKLILSLNKTVVMVSNAFSGQLLSKYDEIILIKDGTILAHGTHEELLESSELYKEIYHIRCEL